MDWYQQNFEGRSEIVEFLRKLNTAGVTPENIKMVATTFGCSVFYFCDRETYIKAAR